MRPASLFSLTLLAVALMTSAPAADYRVVQDSQGHFWFESPAGERFLSIGINNINEHTYNPRPGSTYYAPIDDLFYGDPDAWASDVVDIMERAGLNTVGAWSSPHMNGAGPHETIILYVAGWEDDRCLFGLRSDFEDLVRSRTEEVLAEWPDQDRVMGFFLDNEARWYGGSPWTDVPNHTLMEQAFAQETYPEITEAARAWLRERHGGDIEAFKTAWRVDADSWDALDFAILRRGMTDEALADRAAFIEHVADEWFRRATAVVSELAPGKLMLGVRFAGHAPEGVVRACGRHSDVISFNDYRFGEDADPDPRRMAMMWLWGGQTPLMVTEYSWRASENQSGNPNTGGAGTVVETQAERGRRNTEYLRQLLAQPHVVGAHWFEWADQPPEGRFDGENSNYGIVDIHHRPYRELIASMGRINSRLESIHANSDLEPPTELPEAPAVTFEPGQRPERPPSIDLLAVEPAEEAVGWHAEDAGIGLEPQGDDLILHCNTGEGSWGCGVSLFGPASWEISEAGATDLDGYTTLELEATIPADLTFRVYLEEASVNAPGTVEPSETGDDGESFTSDLLFGSGDRQVFSIPIGSMEHRGDWGNQGGNRRIDMISMKGIALYFPNGQGEQTVTLHGVRLSR